jgi:hypothetical protein
MPRTKTLFKLPAPADATVEASSADWRERYVPEIQRKLADADIRLEAAAKACGIAELCLALGHEGAVEAVAEAREAARVIEIERDGLHRALKRAETELTQAEVKEAAEERDRRRARARALVLDRIGAAAKFDALLRQLAVVADEIDASNRKLAEYAPDTGVSIGRMALGGTYQAAVYVAGPTLAKLLGLSRDKPIPAMTSLVEAERRYWARFTGPIEVPAVAESDAAALSAPAEPRVALDDPSLGRFGGIVLESLSTGGATYPEGTHLSADQCLSWRLPNRRALASMGRVRFYSEPQAPDVSTLLE